MSSFCFEWGDSSGVTLEVVSDGDRGSTWLGELCHCYGPRLGPRHYWSRGSRGLPGKFLLKGGYSWGKTYQDRCRSIS